MVLVDSHCHLDKQYFEPEELADVLQRAQTAGIGYTQTICTQKPEFEEVHGIATKHANVFCSFGIHPHHAGEEPLTLEEIIQNGQKEKVIGIGETGLDYYYEHASREAQKESFRLHLQAARQLDMPVIIHSRDAEDDTISILDEALEQGPMKLLFHCFSSSRKLAEYAVEKSIYVSASGIITFKKSDELRDIFAGIPLELLLVETDSPYLAPVPYRGKRNEPAYTLHVAEQLAEIHNITLEKIAEITTNNFFSLFSKATQ